MTSFLELSGKSQERTFLSSSRGVCRECGKPCESRYVALGESVYLERYCPTHGVGRALVAESLSWYLSALAQDPGSCPPRRTLTTRKGDCPTGCGPCQAHAQGCHLPVFSITNACDLRCPICFTYNRADRHYFMTEAEFARQIDFVLESTGGVDLVNITGGEPTLHPELLKLLAHAQRPGIGRITVNSNGLRLAREPDLAKALADLGVYVILSLDTLDPERSRRIHGRDIVDEKRRALDNLERAGVPVTLLMVLIGGVNEDELGPTVELALSRDHVRSLTVQTMTYTGQGGKNFEPRQHIPVDGVVRRIAAHSGLGIRSNHFVSLPSAHPLCYQVAYLLRGDAGRWHSFSDVLGPEALGRHLASGYLLRPSPELEDELRGAIDRLYSEGGQDELLGGLKAMIRRLYPSGASLSVHERQRRAETAVKTLYIHAHMDEDTFEVGRAMRCPDQVPVEGSRLIGACNYNLFYRQRDPRFWKEP